jgi:hypothetical protein
MIQDTIFVLWIQVQEHFKPTSGSIHTVGLQIKVNKDKIKSYNNKSDPLRGIKETEKNNKKKT